MKTLLTLALLPLMAAGCATAAGGRSASNTAAHPMGTDVGTSNPGINQPTGTTTATRSNDTPR